MPYAIEKPSGEIILFTISSYPDSAIVKIENVRSERWIELFVIGWRVVEIRITTIKSIGS
jgi:hypothetical protein